MKRLKIWFALFKVRTLETELDRLEEALHYVHCKRTRALIRCSRELILDQLTKARAEYTALHPPGVRFMWGHA